MKKIFSIILSVICLFSISACNSGDVPSAPLGNNGTENIENNPQYKSDFQGTHIYNVQDGTVDFVSAARTDFVIVYPKLQENEAQIQFAVKELKNFFNEATGSSIVAVSDEAHTGNEKIVSLGETVQLKNNQTMQLRMNEYDLKKQGFVLETISSAVYIAGPTTFSVLNGVYEFLRHQFGFNYYAEGCYTLDRNVQSSKLKVFNITDVPDIQYRVAGNGDDQLGTDHIRRMRFSAYGDMYAMGDVGYAHNFFTKNGGGWLPKDQYIGEHENWYSVGDSQQQLCLSRDPDGIRAVVFDKMKNIFLEETDRNYIAFILNDGGTWCGCEKCTEERGKYDSDYAMATATMIRFINPLARSLKEWNQTTCPERELRIVIMSYGMTKSVPVKMDENKNPIKDANGNFELYSDEFKLEDNVTVQIAFGTDGGAYKFNPNDTASLDTINRWKLAANEFLYWVYSADFSDYLRPMNSFEGRSGYYQFMAENGGLLSFDNAQYGNTHSTDWGEFKRYVESQHTWNCQISMDVLINEFFDNYYQEASTVMKSMFKEYRDYTGYLWATGMSPMGNLSGASECNTTNWPLKKVMEFMGYLDLAMDVIEPLQKTDPEKYETLYIRILRETITYRYLLIELYPEIYSTTEYANVRAELLVDCRLVGVSERSEGDSIADYLS